MIGVEKDLRMGETTNALFALEGQRMETPDDGVDEGTVLRDCVIHVEEMIGTAVKRILRI
jgi:hypothetical protein